MTRTLLCFGDSNTYGTPPIHALTEPHRRFDAATRWPRLALQHLGEGWDLVEQGLPGRTAQFSDTVMGSHMNAVEALKIALESAGPIDALTIMLGTNDVKAAYAVPPEQVTAGIAGLLCIALSQVMQDRHGGFKVLVICPPPVEEAGCLKAMFWGGRARSLGLPPLYRGLAEAFGVGFLDAGAHVTVSPIDGVHLDEAGHAVLGRVVAEEVARLVG